MIGGELTLLSTRQVCAPPPPPHPPPSATNQTNELWKVHNSVFGTGLRAFVLYTLCRLRHYAICWLDWFYAELSPRRSQGTEFPGGVCVCVWRATIANAIQTPSKHDSALRRAAMRAIANASLTVRSKVARQCPQTTFEEKGESKRNETHGLKPVLNWANVREPSWKYSAKLVGS